MRRSMAKPDPKAQEYALTLENLALMQAKIDVLEAEIGQLKNIMAAEFLTITHLAKAVQTLQEWALEEWKIYFSI